MTIITGYQDIRDLLRATINIAVLGMKTEKHSDQPAFYVPKYLLGAGFEVIPVPVYYPEVTQILGLPVYRKLSDIPGPIDLVNVFRRPQDIDKHVDEILRAKPKAVWFQLGITNASAAEKFAGAGMKVVQNRCIMVEVQKFR